MGDINMSGKGFWHGLANLAMDGAYGARVAIESVVKAYRITIDYLSRAGGCSFDCYGTREDRR